MKKLCDLHIHSVFSDGTNTPKEIVEMAIEKGLSAVALCDHNTVDGVLEFLNEAKGKNIEAVSGAEFSVDYNGKELHLLGLYIPEDKLKIVSDLMEDVIRKKEESNITLVNSLNRAGYKISYPNMKKKTPNGKINRAHIASELTLKGYTKSVDDAFNTLLSKGGDYYTEPKRPSVFYMIEFIKSIGALPVLAHPFLNLSKEELIDFLPLAIKKGLVGMECYYSTYDKELIDNSVELATKFNLKKSGGSDFHGANKPKVKLGIIKDETDILYEDCDILNIKKER